MISAAVVKFVGGLEKQRQPARKLYELPETQIRATLYFRPGTRLELPEKLLDIRLKLLDVTELSTLVHHLITEVKSPGDSTFIDGISQNSRKLVQGTIKTKLTEDAEKQRLPRAEIEILGMFSLFNLTGSN